MEEWLGRGPDKGHEEKPLPYRLQQHDQVQLANLGLSRVDTPAAQGGEYFP